MRAARLELATTRAARTCNAILESLPSMQARAAAFALLILSHQPCKCPLCTGGTPVPCCGIDFLGQPFYVCEACGVTFRDGGEVLTLV